VNADFDLPGELAAGVRDAAGVWRFIHRFAAAYTRPIGAAEGCSDEELRAAEVRLGVMLPDSLREVYRLVGRRPDLTRAQDILLTPAQLEVDESGGVLVFRVEDQWLAQWGFPLGMVGEADPPVVLRRPAEWAWLPFLDRVSLAAVEMVLSEWLFSGGDFYDNLELDQETVAALEARFSRLPVPDYPMWAAHDDRPVRWFHGKGAVLRDDGGAWLWARATSPEALAAVRRALPGEWMSQ
jgi:hypothetical protein